MGIVNEPESTGLNRDERGRFPPGVSGNPAGRPKGSRHKLEEEFLRAMADNFAKGGVETLEILRATDPATYCRIIASLMPKKSDVDVTHHEGESVNQEQARLMAEAFLTRAARTESVG